MDNLRKDAYGMQNILPEFVVIMALVVGLGFFNEKVTRITDEIALMLFSIPIGAIMLGVTMHITGYSVDDLYQKVHIINLEDFLMKGVLCFMLFAGSCQMRLKSFAMQARAVTVLSIFATLLGAVFYGFAFYGFATLAGLGFSIPVCLMFGSIVAPTDPIAATSILKRFNLPKNISFLIEGESLLNDGVGVALFVCFSGMVRASHGEGFFQVMFRELFGAILVGVAVTAVTFPVVMKTTNELRRIFTSLLAVALAYVLCEAFDFSGAIASVVCGVLYSSLRHFYNKHHLHELQLESFDTFWGILDTLLNSMLYVMLGLSFFHILQAQHVILISVIAVICNFIGRGGSLAVLTPVLGEIPDGYDRVNFVKLLTWAGLRGGLCIALAMSTRDMIDSKVYYMILGGTYAIVFFTTVIQGLTMAAAYRRIDASVQKKKQTTTS